jgi:MoxR-like ATPase
MYQKISEALGHAGYMASELIATQIALLLHQSSKAVRAMILDGPPGAGKTALAKAVAKVTGAQFIYVPAHPGSTPEDFLYDANIVQILRGVSGDHEAVKTARDVIDFGFLPMVFEASQRGPVVALVDELDKSSPKCDSLFLTALEEGEVMVKGVGPVKAKLENIILFFTKNGERSVSEPLMRRCRRMYLRFPEPQLEMAILMGILKPQEIAEKVSLKLAGEQPKPNKVVAQMLITAASKLREQELFLKQPCTAELGYAMSDIVYLKEWRVSNEVAKTVVMSWLAAYPEDLALAEQVLNYSEGNRGMVKTQEFDRFLYQLLKG